MFEVAMHTLREKRSGILAFSVFIFIFGIVMVAAYDSIGAEFDFDELLENYPDFILEFFGSSTESFGDFGGFFTLEYVTWVWLLIIPAYLAMVCSGLIAGEIENKTADTLLSYPISRRRVLLEKYAGVIVMVAVVNLMGFLSSYVGISVYGIDYSVKWIGIVMVQATPFLLVWTAAFMFLSALMSDAKKVSTYSIVLVFVAYFVDALSRIWDQMAFLGYLSPMHYFNPGQVMSENIVGWGDTALLAILACVIIGVALYVFDKRDIL